MANLPVNVLLYALYAASTGLIGGIGWTFYSTYKLKQRIDDPAFRKEISQEVDKHLKAGKDMQPERRNWQYQESDKPWWMQFGSVNITGKLPAPPEKAPEPEVVEKPVDTGIPIGDIVVLESLLLEVVKDTSKPTSQVTHVVVRYKPGVEVHPPPDLVAAASPTGPTRPAAWNPGDSTPKPASGPAPVAAIPMASGASTELRQFVRLEETLWPPHNALKLVRIDEDGQTAYFLREDAKKERAEWKEERLDKNELELDATVVKNLRDEQRRVRGEQPTESGPETKPANQEQISDWRDPPETGEVNPGHVHVSRRDHDYIRDNVDRVFNDEVGVSSYKSRVGNYEGVRIDRVSPRLQQFGVQPGDVILSVNGEKVRNKTQAFSVGKRQYEAGARRFVVEVLSGRGTGVETRTISVQKN